MKTKYPFYLLALLPFALLMGILITSFGNFYSSPLHREVDAFLQSEGFQGSILIAKGGKVIFKKGYGFANEEYKIVNTPQTVFRIGSITKQFTAIAILKLQEQGKLNVYEPILKYLPDYPKGNEITIHHLLCHTSGIPDITDFPNLQEIQRHPSTPNQVIGYFKELPLNFKPGADCEYSNSNYIVLGAIIEAAANQSYEQFIQENILRPLGMNATYYDHNRSLIPQRAVGYERNDQGKLLHANYIDMSFPHAAGALATTVEDLYQLDRALQKAALLSKKSTDSLFHIHGSSQKNQMAYGYGFFIGSRNVELEQARGYLVGHYGTIEGFRAASFRYPDEDLTIILLSNVENTPINDLHLALAQIIRSTWRPSASF